VNQIELILKDIDDQYVRENFTRLNEYIRKDSIRKPLWKFFEITFADGGTDIEYAHNLGYKPLDIIVTHCSSNENVVFNFDSFTSTHFVLSPSGACTVRFFAGRYEE
jgi:hypothetical protein